VTSHLEFFVQISAAGSVALQHCSADPREEDLIHAAVSQNLARVVRALVRTGSDVNATARPEMDATDVDRRTTALHVAVERDSGEMASLLIELGADVDREQIPDGQTALHLASRHGSISMIRVLLAAGADVNKTATVDGLTEVILFSIVLSFNTSVGF